jgi:hypothetical protein
MEQPTEPISSHDPRRRRQGNAHAGSQWRCPPHGAVRAVAVVMVGGLGQHRPQLPAAGDAHPVQQLLPDGADPPLGVGLGPRRPHRRPQHPDPSAATTASKPAGSLASRSRTSNRTWPTRSSRPMSRLRACRVPHAPMGCAVTPSTGTRRPATSRTTAPPAVAGPRCPRGRSPRPARRCLRPEDLPPAQRRPLGRRFDAGPVEDGPDGAGPDPEAQPAQLTVAATGAPGRVLGGRPHHQRPKLGRHRRATRRVRVAPAASDQLVLAAQQRRGPDEPPVPARARQPPGQPGQHRVVGPVHPGSGHLPPQQLDLEGATCAARCPWSPSAAPAAPAIPAAGRRSGPAVQTPSTDHRRPASPSANTQLRAYDDLLAPTGQRPPAHARPPCQQEPRSLLSDGVLAANLPQGTQRHRRLLSYGLASWAWSKSTLRWSIGYGCGRPLGRSR